MFDCPYRCFLGTESPLTVTQMLWVNLIMDTFAALALASLPPDERVMRDKPRHLNDNIVTRPMAGGIIGTGIAFVLLLFGLLQYFKHVDITSLAQFDLSLFFTHFFNFAPVPGGLTRYELTLSFPYSCFYNFGICSMRRLLEMYNPLLIVWLHVKDFCGLPSLFWPGRF